MTEPKALDALARALHGRLALCMMPRLYPNYRTSAERATFERDTAWYAEQAYLIAWDAEQAGVSLVPTATLDALRAALDQALYGPSDEQAQIGRVCARCSRRLDDGEQHVETCPYISLAEVLDRA